MFRFRTGYRTKRLLRQSLLWLVVMGQSCSLILMGGLIWVNNTWAVLPDDDPATPFSVTVLYAAMTGAVDCSALGHDGDGQIPIDGGKLLKGNGDQDDNREESFAFPPLAASGRMGWSVSANYNQSRQTPLVASVSKVGTDQKLRPRPSGFIQRRLAATYKDFGHLKLMSAEGGNSDIFASVFIHKEGHLYIMGGLSCCCGHMQMISSYVLGTVDSLI